jgi:hypothetical protein
LKSCNGQEWVDNIEAWVRHLLKRIIEQYNKFNGSVVSNFDVGIGSSNVVSLNVVDDDLEDNCDMKEFNSLFSQYLVEENDLGCMSEMERYLLDWCETTTTEFNILA